MCIYIYILEVSIGISCLGLGVNRVNRDIWLLVKVFGLGLKVSRV